MPRALYLTLQPFTRREIMGDLDRPPFVLDFMELPSLPKRRTVDLLEEEEILIGGLPPIAPDRSVDRDLWLMGYERTYLERDLSGLKAFAKSTPQIHSCVLAYNGTEAVALGENLYAIPIGLLLL